MRRPSGDQRGSRFTAPSATSGVDSPVAEIEQPELDGVVAVGGVDDPPPVGRPVGLVVVPGPVGELPRLGAARPAGARASPASSRPARSRRATRSTAAGPAGDLRDEHLAVVVRMADLDLLQHRRPLGAASGTGQRASETPAGRERAATSPLACPSAPCSPASPPVDEPARATTKNAAPPMTLSRTATARPCPTAEPSPRPWRTA